MMHYFRRNPHRRAMVGGDTHLVRQETESVFRTNVVKVSPFKCPEKEKRSTKLSPFLVGICR